MALTRVRPQGLESTGMHFLNTTAWQSGVNTYDFRNGPIFYHPIAPTANWTADFTNLPTVYPTNQGTTPVYNGIYLELKICAPMGATAYYANVVRIGGAAATLVTQSTTTVVNKFNIWTYVFLLNQSTWSSVRMKTVEAF